MANTSPSTPTDLRRSRRYNITRCCEVLCAQQDHNLRFCPDWTASQLSGRPKKTKRKKSIIESATGKKGKKKASGVKRARGYCQTCGAYNHVTNDCWNLPSNAHKRPKYFATMDEEKSVGNNDDDDEPSVGEDSEELGQTGTTN